MKVSHVVKLPLEVDDESGPGKKRPVTRAELYTALLETPGPVTARVWPDYENRLAITWETDE